MLNNLSVGVTTFELDSDIDVFGVRSFKNSGPADTMSLLKVSFLLFTHNVLEGISYSQLFIISVGGKSKS